jgi:DNA primase
MDFASQLKSQVDIVEVVREYVPRLKKLGASYKACCPFHNEKTPSFNVHGDRQFFKCFGCGKGGTVIDFVMEMDGLTFWEACKQLAERHGIPLPKRSEAADEETQRRAGVLEAQEIAQKAFRAALAGTGGAPARAYLERRGLSAKLIEEFGIGYSERGGQAMVQLLQRSGIGPDILETTGLVLRRNDGSGFFDRFRNRLMFPIHNETGKLIAFAGRALDDGDEPKYLNSPETPAYRKSQVLYNLHRARKAVRQSEASILVEGYMDVIGLCGAGVENVVASCGTALTSQQARMLKRHAEQIVVNFDADAAGVNAAERSIQVLLEEDMRIRILELGGGMDPDEFVKARGAEAYRAAYEKAPRYFFWLADRARSRFDVRSAEGRVEGLRFLLPSIQRIPDKIERAAIANDVAAYLGVEASLVLEQFRKAAAARSEAEVKPKCDDLPATEKLLAHCLIESAEARGQLGGRVKALAGGLKMGKVLEAILAAGEPPDWSAAEARLESREAALLNGLHFADLGNAGAQGEDMPAQAAACVETLEAAVRSGGLAGLKAKVKEAEREGRLEDALALMKDLDAAERGVARGTARGGVI